MLQGTHPTFLEGPPRQVNVYKFFYSQYLTNNPHLRDYLQEYLINHQLIEQMENENIIYQGDFCYLIGIFNYQNGSNLQIPPHRRLIGVYFDQCDVGDIGYDAGERAIGESSQPGIESHTEHSEAEGHSEQIGGYGEGDVGESSHNIEGEVSQTPHSQTGDYESDQGSHHEGIEEMPSSHHGSGSNVGSHTSHRGSRSDVGSHISHHASGSSSGRSSQGNGKSGLFSCFGFDCFRGKNGKS